MKKKIAVVLIVLICVVAVIFASGKSRSRKEPDNGTSVTESTVTTTKKNQKEEKTTQKVTEKETKKESSSKKKDPNKIVEFEIPVLFLDTKYQNNLKALVRDEGYESAVFTRNGSAVKISLKNISYDLHRIEIGIITMKAICETFDSEDFPYVKNLGEYEDNFSYVTLLVDSGKYLKADNKDKLFSYVSDCCAYYLLQDKDGPDKYTIDICDVKTGNGIESRQFNKNDYLK